MIRPQAKCHLNHISDQKLLCHIFNDCSLNLVSDWKLIYRRCFLPLCAIQIVL